MLAPVRAETMALSGETLGFMQKVWGLVHALDVRSKRMARTLGVTGPQRLVIRILGRSPFSTASDVAATLGIHASTLSGILKRLDDQGLLQRRADPHDRRLTRCQLTAKGRSIDRERKGTVEAAVRRALARCNERDVATTLSVLDLLRAELERDDE